jgi:hypothetical protein
MKDGKPSKAGEPDRRGPPIGRRGSAPVRPRNFVDRATALGHSGHGSESVRPHLRDQLKLKALLPSPFPPPEQETPSKDEHHR